MVHLAVHNVPDAVHRALRVGAARHGRSIEAEVRAILEESLRSDDRIKPGSLLAEVGRQARLADDDIVIINRVRDTTPAEPERAE